MSSPLVSIIIPAYNYGHFIKQSLDCVLAQTYQNWECLVIDDGSTDNTWDIVSSYLSRDRRFKYIYQTNEGASSARNLGLRNSAGKYIQFLDADDLIENRKIELQLNYLEAHTEIDIVYGSGYYFSIGESNDDLSPVWREALTWMPEIHGSGQSSLLALIERPFIIHSPLVRRSVIESVGYFKEDLRSCEDWHFWIRCAMQGKSFSYEDFEDAKALYRRHTTSLCAGDRALFFAGIRTFREEVNKIVTDAKALRLNRRLAAEYEGYIGAMLVKEGFLLTGVKQFLKAGQLIPGFREKLKWFYCALIAPLAPQDQFEQIVSFPVTRSIKIIIRHHLRIAF